MASLNQLASRIARIVREPYNHELLERIKDGIKDLRATRLRQSIERNGIDKFYELTYTAPLQLVDKADNCLVDVDCDILRSVNPIAEPVRYKTDVPFTFVGSPDGIEFTFLNDLSKHRHMKHLKYMGETFFYYFRNGYLYLLNAKRIEFVTLTSTFLNPEDAVTICGDETCYTDDDEFPCPADLVNGIITELLKTQFGLTKPLNFEVDVDESLQK